MADLQDEAHAAIAVGALDQPSVPPVEPPPDDGAEKPAETLDLAHTLLAAHPVADGYNELPWALRSLAWYDLELGESSLETDIPRLRKGGVGAQFWSLRAEGDCPVGSTLEQIDHIQAMIRSYPEGLRIALTAADAAHARACGRIASLLGPAEARAIGDSLGTLRALHQLGVRSITLSGTGWAAGERGLSRFGLEVVREMNRLGMLIDLSGADDATMRATLSVSKAPVLFFRSAARALTDHPANIPDDVLASLGRGRGLCMVTFAARQTGPAIQDVADHLDHVRELAGAECVGLSGAYDTGEAHAPDLSDASCYPRLIAELLDRGWSQTDLAGLTWGNLQRVLREAEFAARAAQARRGPSTARIEDLDG